uniref:hypothetical protein n=1 Tax=uncultured Dysgonomonas sp. TaxID=206096 RepID=UPI0026224A16|nr:hypothetical protein [uncultured Dysgonomonas sp.]
MKKILLFLMFSIFVNIMLYSQVGINTENPNVLTELDVQNLAKEGIVVPKGVMIPRMTEEQRDLIDVSDASLANSLVVYNITEDCFNYYSKIEGEWRSVCGKLGKAVFDFDCSAIEVQGTYVEKKELNSSNALKIIVTVTKPGEYSIAGTTTNGYYFSTSGTFLTAGVFTVYVQGQGTPLNIGEDVVSILKNGEDANCANLVKVNVLSAIAIYSLNCSSIVVNGDYAKGVGLTAANTITLNVNVSQAGSYSITTPLTNGVIFSASGNFTPGIQLVTLRGTGIPTVNTDFPITINANTPEGNNTCTATIPVILPVMTYGVIGSGEYSWVGAARQLAINNGASFGPAGIVKTMGWNRLWQVTSASAAYTQLTNGTAKPDIILYFAYGANATTALATVLADYVNNGGVLIYAPADDQATVTNYLLSGIFGSSAATAVNIGTLTSANRDSYPINNLPNDPIVNGPFGNLSGRYWQEDNAGTVICTSLPPNSVQVASANNPNHNSNLSPDYSVVWYNDSKNFVYFGDSVYGTYPGFAYYGSTDGTAPTQFTAAGLPMSKFNNRWTSFPTFVYNSYLELNAIAWGIKKAAVSGINAH